VDHANAENASNYNIVGLTVVQAVRDAIDYTRVVLDTSPQSDAAVYMLTVSGVTDLNRNPMGFPNYEDFYGTGPVDMTRPTVLSATRIDSNTVEVKFSEPMDKPSAEYTSSYSFRDNMGNTVPATSVAVQSDPSRVWIDISGAFAASLYTLTVDQTVMDINANTLAPYPNETAVFFGEGTVPETLGDGPVLIDPMGEGGNDFSMLAKYRGRIYIGPADTDSAVFRLKPDGTDPELVSFGFRVASTYADSLDPGPDGENGIDFITGGLIGGEEYLFIGPSKSGGNLDHIYFTRERGGNLDFSPMNLTAGLGGQTKGVSAMKVFNDNLYVGFPDTGGARPYILKIVNIMKAPLKDVDFFELKGQLMPRIGKNGAPNNTANIIGIDSFGVFQDRIFLANGGSNAVDKDGGVLRSTLNDPDGFDVDPSHWEDVTPTSDTEWYSGGSRFSMDLPALNKLIPDDRAFPAMVEFNNKLYVIRNTDDFANRPQLWKFDGAVWTLVANNGTGISNMGNPNNSAASLLVENGNHLYIGYDNATDGVQLWRTRSSVTDPYFESDFEPVSTDGFGDPSKNRRIYHGLSIASFGDDYLWLLSGRSGGALCVYRTKN
jgi:hypothetical protein